MADAISPSTKTMTITTMRRSQPIDGLRLMVSARLLMIFHSQWPVSLYRIKSFSQAGTGDAGSGTVASGAEASPLIVVCGTFL